MYSAKTERKLCEALGSPVDVSHNNWDFSSAFCLSFVLRFGFLGQRTGIRTVVYFPLECIFGWQKNGKNVPDYDKAMLSQIYVMQHISFEWSCVWPPFMVSRAIHEWCIISALSSRYTHTHPRASGNMLNTRLKRSFALAHINYLSSEDFFYVAVTRPLYPLNFPNFSRVAYEKAFEWFFCSVGTLSMLWVFLTSHWRT